MAGMSLPARWAGDLRVRLGPMARCFSQDLELVLVLVAPAENNVVLAHPAVDRVALAAAAVEAVVACTTERVAWEDLEATEGIEERQAVVSGTTLEGAEAGQM